MGINANRRCQCKQSDLLIKIIPHSRWQKLVKQKANQILNTSNSFRMQNSADIDDICIIVSFLILICCPINISQFLFSLRSENLIPLLGNTKIIGRYEICSSYILRTLLLCPRRKERGEPECTYVFLHICTLLEVSFGKQIIHQFRMLCYYTKAGMRRFKRVISG